MIRKLIMNSTFLRNGKLLFGNLANYSAKPGEFIPYFQYNIGSYKDDFILYFNRMPSALLYYNSIFLKIWAYFPQDAIRYIEDNYNKCPNKKDFLQFLKREVQFKIFAYPPQSRSKRLAISNICLDWANEKLKEYQEIEKVSNYNQFVRNDLTVILKNEFQQTSGLNGNGSTEQMIDRICNNLQDKLNTIPENIENKLMELANKYETGDIQLANLNLKDKLITLFLTLKNISGKPNRSTKSGEPLFIKMDLNDIAQILRLHFSNYKGLKIDSIEKRIYEVNNNQKMDDPAVADLTKTLQKFFFN